LRVVHVITGLGRGGAESTLLQLCSASHGSDWQHTVVSLTDRGEVAAALEAAGIPVIDLGMKSPLSMVPATWRLRKILRDLDPDIVQTWMYHADFIGGLASRLAGIRSLVWGIRSSLTDSRTIKRRNRALVRVCARMSGSVPARIVACANAAAETHAQVGYRRDKMIVIQNGIDVARFTDVAAADAEQQSAGGSSGDRPLLGMVARFTPQKDHRNLFGALKILVERGESFQCTLVGNAMDSANDLLVRWIGEFSLDDHVVLMGPRNDLPDIMRALDLHVLSSAVEGFPNVLAEAMACGTPCVSTDTGDAAYIVGDTGWLVPKDDPGALAAAISDALTERRESPQVWQNRRAACRTHIQEHFGLQRMIDRYADVWRATAAGR
jgi:glycosyltransferase involved in cell wall biosynthesis